MTQPLPVAPGYPPQQYGQIPPPAQPAVQLAQGTLDDFYGQPTVGETNPENIVKNVAAKNSANTRIFTFGVGDDVNAVLLDKLAEKTRSLSTYVRDLGGGFIFASCFRLARRTRQNALKQY